MVIGVSEKRLGFIRLPAQSFGGGNIGRRHRDITELLFGAGVACVHPQRAIMLSQVFEVVTSLFHLLFLRHLVVVVRQHVG